MFGKGKNILNPEMSVGQAMTRAFLVNLAGGLGTMAAFGVLGHLAMKAQEKAKNDKPDE
jgi:hypothetical protein